MIKGIQYYRPAYERPVRERPAKLFSVQGWTAHVLGFVGHMASVATIQLCCSNSRQNVNE